MKYIVRRHETGKPSTQESVPFDTKGEAEAHAATSRTCVRENTEITFSVEPMADTHD